MYAKNVYEIDQELGGGELPLSTCPGVGNRPARKKKVANAQGYAGGGGGEGGTWLHVKFNQALLFHFSVAPAGAGGMRFTDFLFQNHPLRPPTQPFAITAKYLRYKALPL